MIEGEPLKVGFTGPVYMGFTELAHFSYSLLTLLIFFRGPSPLMKRYFGRAKRMASQTLRSVSKR
jgi:hypothetical protein